MSDRDEFEEDGILDGILKRRPDISMPPSMARTFMAIAGLILLVIVIVIAWVTWPDSERVRVDEALLPVITAQKGDIKIKPEEPGGMNVPYKDSTIFEAIKSDDEDSKIENLLEDEEVPMKKEEVFAKKEPEKKPDIVIVSSSKDQPAPKEIVEEKKVEPKVAPAPVEKAEVKPEPKVVAKEEPKTETKPVETGSSFVQLASVKSESEAQTKWAQLQKKYSVLSGQSLNVQKAELGAKGTFYRVRVGPMSYASATQTCSKIKAAKGDCLVLK